MPLEIHQVAHAYGRGPLRVADVSLTLTPGVTGLVGANGAGKSTLIRIAAGAQPPRRGSVMVDGASLYDKQSRAQALAAVAWMPQTPSQPRNVSALEFVSYLTWLRGVNRREAQSRAKEALSQVKLERVSEVKMGQLSGGMLRRVWLAQALASRADVLLLDEPSTGLDPRQRATMVELLAEQCDRTILLSSHLLEDVVDLADRVVVLDAGRVVHDGPTPHGADRDWLLRFLPLGDA